MIEQMVTFTIDNGSWETTRDSFNERYDGHCLDYALAQLNAAFDKEFTENE